MPKNQTQFRRHNPKLPCFWVLFLFAGLAQAQEPLEPNLFQAGIYGDLNRAVTCVTGATGSTFTQYIWAWVPDELGLAYITIRFRFPENLDLSARPEFHPLVTDVIITEYPANTREWNMVFSECPSGWIQVFSQECAILDDQPGRVEILAANSMMRDCQFILNDLIVLNELGVNDPDCLDTPTAAGSWGSLKNCYR